MKLPGMTEDVADAILDWIDTDDEPLEYGAEIDYYSSLSPPYAPRNGPLQSVEELLLVRGVTPAMLFGRDINRNGMIDAHEQELPLMLDVDPGDGSMDCGWSSYLTLYSMEKNASSDGQPRINLNGDDMQQLYEDLSAVDTAWATFIVAYRQSGAYQGNSQQTEPAGEPGPGPDAAGQQSIESGTGPDWRAGRGPVGERPEGRAGVSVCRGSALDDGLPAQTDGHVHHPVGETDSGPDQHQPGVAHGAAGHPGHDE